MDINPESLPVAERYKLLIGGIVPRPIAWVSTLSPAGKPNLAPFSFFTGASSNPMTILFCPANKPDGSDKDTLRNVLPAVEGGTGEFAVCVVPRALANQMAACAEPLEYGESEWALSGLRGEASAMVKPLRVVGSPLAFECRTERVIRLNAGEPSGGNIVLGRVVSVHAGEGVMNERHHVDPGLLDAIGRMGGQGYCTTRDRFDLPAGRAALQQL